jgi:hypothetical protein
MNVRKQLLAGHFPEDVLNEILKACTTLTADQFCSFYKFLMAEKSSITEIYKKALQEEAETIQPIDYTRAILEAKYGKK